MIEAESRTDAVLLSRYAFDGEAAAFEAIVRRYAGMVYGAAKRVLVDAHAAEDVAQECFAALARSPGTVDRSVAGWLHARATSQARNRLREGRRRRRREWEAAMDHAGRAESRAEGAACWQQVRPVLDAAVTDLPDEYRQPIIMHFLEGAPQTVVAERLGVNQSTISRRLSAAMDRLRDSLSGMGVTLPSVALAVLLAENAATAAPTHLVSSLAALGAGSTLAVGTATSTTGAAAGGALFTASAAKIVGALILVLGLAGGGYFVIRAPSGDSAGARSPMEKAMHPSATPSGADERLAPNVQRDGPRTWIENVRKLNGGAWRIGEIDAIAAAAEPAAGRDLYDQLLAMSGMAFRVQTLPRQIWCPSAASPRFGFNGLEQLADAARRAGFRFEVVDIDARLPTEVSERMIVDRINAGQPVATTGPWWVGVIVGYRRSADGPLKLEVVSYDHPPTKPLVTSDRPTRLLLLDGRVPTADRQTAIESVRLAVRLATMRGEAAEHGEYVAGPPAYAAWAAMLREADDSERMVAAVKAHAGDGGIAECHRRNLAWLASSRASAGRYLAAVAPTLDPDAAERLRAAAAACHDLAGSLEALTQAAAWTTEHRRTMADGIDNAAAAEQRIVGLLDPVACALPIHREGDRVRVQGVTFAESEQVNGYIRGIAALVEARGAPISYERLMGLSGMAFILQVNPEHRWEGVIDAGWWPLDPVGVDARKRFLSDAVGYEFVEIGQVFSLAGWQQLQPRLQEIYAERMKAPVEAAIGAGQPALTGWCGTNAEMGFVIHGYENTGAGPPIVGICARSTGGAVERCTDWPYGVLILGKREIPLATDTADIAALRYAVRLARDEVRLTDAQPWLVGQKGYAFWAALLRNTDEPVRPFHHANVIQHLVWNRTAATAFLREVAGRQRGAAVGPLLDAAKIYEQVVDTAGQMSTRGLGDGEQARRALADDVDALAQLERQAAEAIDMAVTEMTLKREGGKVWIDNVNRFSPGEFASSVHGVQARILETLGEAISYEDLVCYGGFAFRANWHKAGCPSAGHPCCGYMCVGNSQRALPWRSKVFEAFPWGKQRSDEQRQAFEAEACAAIKASIDRGIPVHYGGEEDGLIIGYADEGRRWWCVHPYHKGGGEPFWHDEAGGFAGSNRGWPWGIVVWTEPKSVDERSTDRDLTLGALRQAVDMWQTEIRGDYFCGDAAYAQWVAWLRGIDAGEVTDPKAGMQGNGWCYDVLVHSRRIAAPWLERKAELFDGEAREQLLTAASAYERIPGICLKGATCPWDIAPGPSSFDDWSAEMRSEQVRRLEEARECDRAAIAAIGRALAVMEDAP